MEKMNGGDNEAGSTGIRPAGSSRAAVLEKLRKFFQSETLRCNALRTRASELQNLEESLDVELEMVVRKNSELLVTIQEIQAFENEEMEDANAGIDQLEAMSESCYWIADSLDDSFATTKYAEEAVRGKIVANAKFLQDVDCVMEKQTSAEEEAEAIYQDRSELHVHLVALEKKVTESNDRLAAMDAEVNQKNSDLSSEFASLQLLFTEFQNVKTSLEKVNRTNTTLEEENKHQEDTVEAMKEELIREQEAWKEEDQLEKEVLENASGVQVQIEENTNQHDSWIQQRSDLTNELEAAYENHQKVMMQLKELKEKFTELTEVEQVKQKDVSECVEELERIREESQRFKNSEEVSKQNIVDQKNKIDLQNEIYAETVAALKDRDDQLKDSAQTVEIQEDSVNQMEVATKQAQEYRDNLEHQHEAILSDLAAEAETCENLNKNVASLKQELALLVNEIEQQIQIEQDQEKEPNVLKERITFLEDQLSDHANLQQAKTAIENDLVSVREDLETVMPKFSQLTERKLELQSDAEKCERDLKHCLETKEGQFQDFRKECEELRQQLGDLLELKETRSESIAALNSTENEKVAHIEVLASQLQTVTSELAEKQVLFQDRTDAIKAALQVYDEKKILLEVKIGEMEGEISDLSDVERWASRDLIQLEEELKQQQEQRYPELMTEEETKEEEKIQMVKANLRDLTSEVQHGEKDMEQIQVDAAKRIDEIEATKASSEATLQTLKGELAKLQVNRKELQENLDNISLLQSSEDSKNTELTKDVAKVEKKTKTTKGHHSVKDVQTLNDYIQHEDNEIGQLSNETKKLREMITMSLGSEEKTMQTRLAKKKSVVTECQKQISILNEKLTSAERERQKETLFRLNLDKLKNEEQELDNNLARILSVSSEKTKELKNLQQKQQNLKTKIQASIQKREEFEALKFKKPLPGRQAEVGIGKQVRFQSLERHSPDIIYGTDTEIEASQPLQRKSLPSVLKGNTKTSSK